MSSPYLAVWGVRVVDGVSVQYCPAHGSSDACRSQEGTKKTSDTFSICVLGMSDSPENELKMRVCASAMPRESCIRSLCYHDLTSTPLLIQFIWPVDSTQNLAGSSLSLPLTYSQSQLSWCRPAPLTARPQGLLGILRYPCSGLSWMFLSLGIQRSDSLNRRSSITTLEWGKLYVLLLSQ